MNNKLIVLTGIFFLLFGAAAFPQEQADWYVNKPIKDIHFLGLQNVSEADLEGITEQYIGKKFTDQLFLELQSKLYALDYFEIFVPNAIPGDDDYNSIIVEFDVEERPVVDEIRLKGNQNIRRNEILDVILLKTGDIINKTKVQLDADAVQQLYIERGFPDISIESEIEPDPDNNLAAVTFYIEEGSQTRIKEIRFSGNDYASDGTLQRLMETKPQALFSKGVFQESKFEEDISKIEQYYNENGYIDAEVVNVKRGMEKDEDDDRNYLVLTIFIEEGEQYVYDGMEIEGNTLFTDEELLEAVTHREGDVLNKTKLEGDFLRLADIYYNEGYIYNQITREPVRDEADNTVRYKVEIIEQGRAHIESIIVQGNEKTKDFVIYRELPFETGDVFSKQKIMEGLQNLYNTGLFSSVTPTTPMGSVDGLMDLVINIEEAKTIDLNFGVTFSGAGGDFPVLGFFKWTDRNFLGRGDAISAGVELSGTSQKLTFGFDQNWLFGKRWSWGADFSIEHALSRRIKQDIISPVFAAEDPNAVPDPYEGYYVFSEETEYPAGSGSVYAAGTAFPGVPTEEDVTSYNLITDYQYDLNQGIGIGSAYLMEYHSLILGLGLTTGYQWFTNAGRLGISTGARTNFEYLTYDDTLYRPFNATTRKNLDSFSFTNKLWLNLSWDTRDLIMNPSKGFHINQNVQYVGGLLFGITNYIRSSSKAEVFFTLFDVPVFKNWNWKMVLALHSDFAIIVPNYRYNTESGTWGWSTALRDSDYLYIDSMQIARGWGYKTGGTARWNNFIELRMPIFEQFLWLDFFFSGTAMWEDNSFLSSMNIDDFLFTFGAGPRITIPGFPMGFYFGKRFKTEDGVIQWQTGNIGGTSEGAGLDFIISFTYEIF